MLIIFDLDDTLIDTSASIFPEKFRETLQSMKSAGLEVKDFAKDLCRLLKINEKAKSGREALAHFLQEKQGSFEVRSIGERALYGELPKDLSVLPIEGALETLKELFLFHELSLVTIGKREIQLDKLKKAGMDSSFFRMIMVADQEDKKPYYKDLMVALNYSPSEVVVCGDRIVRDLMPAKELHCHTVHLRKGRGKQENKSSEFVDHSILELSELKEIVASLEKGMFSILSRKAGIGEKKL